MLSLKKYVAGMLALGFCCAAAIASAAPITQLRSSISPARVRLVLDSAEPITYKVDKNKLELEISMPASTAKKQQLAVKDKAIKSVKLQPAGSKGSLLEIVLNKDCQYKVYQLRNPNRLVVDIFRINIMRESKELAKGVTYTYIQDELNGKQIQGYVVALAKDSKYELRPFSANHPYNGRAHLSSTAARLNLLAATNASYFDTDGWVIGCTKSEGQIISMDDTPRSAYVVDQDGSSHIVKDVAYSGSLRLANGKYLSIKGMNRGRIADDLVLFNEAYAPSTKTNAFGREIKIKGTRVISVSTLGNMPIEKGTVVISGHGVNADALASVRVGDRVVLTESLGSTQADNAKTVVGGGPMVLDNAQVNIRTSQEQIAPDIARGRAPRTAVGIKKDGTVLLMVVDGRSQLSAGLTLQELALFMLRQGAVEAVNFDGGGSSEMVIRGKLVNNPSDGVERPVSMGIGVFPRN